MKATLITSTALAAAIISLTAACGSPASSSGAEAGPTPSTVEATTKPASSLDPSLLPEPTGPAVIGVRDVPSVSPDADARLWYPALPGSGTGQPPYTSAATAASLGVTADVLHDARLRATFDALPAATATPRPGVLLMPGWGSPMALSTSLAQDLASNGYVVLSVEPTLGTEDPDHLPADPAKPARRLEQLRTALDLMTGPTIAALAGPVDANRVAAGGHSIAGALAMQVSLTDPRIAAAFDLDGWLHGPALDTPIEVPALFVEASGFDAPTDAAIARATHAVTVGLAGATHFDVTDVPCLVAALGPNAALLGLGTIGCTGSTTTNSLVERFLNAALHDGRSTPDAADLARALPGVL